MSRSPRFVSPITDEQLANVGRIAAIKREILMNAIRNMHRWLHEEMAGSSQRGQGPVPKLRVRNFEFGYASISGTLINMYLQNSGDLLLIPCYPYDGDVQVFYYVSHSSRLFELHLDAAAEQGYAMCTSALTLEDLEISGD
jgi:hypothetical protein